MLLRIASDSVSVSNNLVKLQEGNGETDRKTPFRRKKSCFPCGWRLSWRSSSVVAGHGRSSSSSASSLFFSRQGSEGGSKPAGRCPFSHGTAFQAAWNSVSGRHMVPSWRLNSVLGAVTASSWPWNVWGVLIAELALGWHSWRPEEAKLVLELRLWCPL